MGARRGKAWDTASGIAGLMGLGLALALMVAVVAASMLLVATLLGWVDFAVPGR